MILTCPRCGYYFEDLKEEKEKILTCPSCKSNWSIKKKEKRDLLCWVADSPRGFRKFLVDCLKELKFNVEIYEDGLLLKKSIENKLPHLLILNVFLPNVLGVEICEDIKSKERTRFLPIILIGAIHKVERYHRKPKYLYGADEYIEEGISKAVFKSIIKRLVGLPYDKGFSRTPEEVNMLRKMRIFVSFVIDEYKDLVEKYLNGGSKDSLKEFFMKASLKLKEKEPTLSEDLMKSFLIQYIKKKIEERKNG